MAAGACDSQGWGLQAPVILRLGLLTSFSSPWRGARIAILGGPPPPLPAFLSHEVHRPPVMLTQRAATAVALPALHVGPRRGCNGTWYPLGARALDAGREWTPRASSPRAVRPGRPQLGPMTRARSPVGTPRLGSPPARDAPCRGCSPEPRIAHHHGLRVNSWCRMNFPISNSSQDEFSSSEPRMENELATPQALASLQLAPGPVPHRALQPSIPGAWLDCVRRSWAFGGHPLRVVATDEHRL